METPMNDLYEAYRTLRLQFGAPLEEVLSQHRMLVEQHHSYHRQTGAEKLRATEDLQRIDDAKDRLRDYFQRMRRSGATRSVYSAIDALLRTPLPQARGPVHIDEQKPGAYDTNFEELELTGFDIDGNKLANILASLKFQYPRRITIRGARITDTDLRLLGRFWSLEHFDLIDCPNITDFALTILFEFQPLRVLCVRNTQVTEGAAREFAKLRPNCRVQYGPRRSCP
jgi:hypothetical protein